MQDMRASAPKGTTGLASQIRDCLTRGGAFTYYEGVDTQLLSFSKSVSKLDFFDSQSYYFTNKLRNIQLSFVLYAVHCMGHATKEMIVKWLQWYKRCFPEKLVPCCSIDDKKNETQINSLIKESCKHGLMMGRDYVSIAASPINIYTTTLYGHIFFRNKLNLYSVFDQNAMFHSELACFKRLASNSVALTLSQNERCTHVCLNGKFGFGGKYSDIDGFMHGLVEYDGGGMNGILFFIEPVFFNYDSRITSEEEVETQFLNRMKQLESMYGKLKEYCPRVYMIFLLEDIRGLDKLTQLVLYPNLDMEMYENALLTSENVLHQMNGELGNVFLKLVDVAGKPTFRAIGPEWLPEQY